eukprot:6199474-Pleurochrysis_carterae.AAC.4
MEGGGSLQTGLSLPSVCAWRLQHVPFGPLPVSSQSSVAPRTAAATSCAVRSRYFWHHRQKLSKVMVKSLGAPMPAALLGELLRNKAKASIKFPQQQAT